MSTTVVINEAPKFNLSVQQGDGPAVTLSQPDAPALTLSMSGPQGPTGATGAAGPNSVTSSTTSDGTGTLSLSSLSLSTPLPLASGGTNATTASAARTNLGLGTADTPTFSNLTLATGTITVPQPLAFTQTWNSTATFTALQMNITDSGPSNAASLLMDLRVGGVSRFNVRRDGTISFKAGANTADISSDGTGRVLISSSSTAGARINGDLQIGGTSTILLQDGAANTLAQRNLGSAQEFRLYGTTNAGVTEYERLKLKYNSTTLSYQIGTEKGGTTTSARPLEFQTDGTTRMYVHPTNGRVGIATTSPLATLHVNGSIVAYSNLNFDINAQVRNTSTAGGQSLKLVGSGGTPDGFIDLIPSTSASSTGEYVRISGGPSGTTEIARFLGTGKVGIGTTNPVSKLEVVSTTSELPAGNGILRFSTSTGSNDRGNKIGAVAGSGSDGYSYWQAVRPGIASDGNISINPLGGSVGIGSTTPTALLDVNSDTFRLRTARTPASATAAGNAGDICWDSNYIYICTATNTWKRAAIATWP